MPVEAGSQRWEDEPMKLIERLRRWWSPGEYDDERPPSDGEGFALSDGEYEEEAEVPIADLVYRHGPGN
jgi:hypothetical protein